MKETKIEWTDSTWNPLRGCSRVSEGCRNCYAENMAARFSGKVIKTDDSGTYEDPLPYHGLATMTSDGPRWTGKVVLVKNKLSDPLRWKRPRRIFVNSMSDLFHESVPDEWIDQIFAVMALSPQHTFQVLTKRADRMHEYFGDSGYGGERWTKVWNARLPMCGKPVPPMPWPLSNVHLGVSVENQEAADERIPLLFATPAPIRWISAEPLLEEINIRSWLLRSADLNIDWAVVGGESGPGARNFNLEWAGSLIEQARNANVPIFVKQMGSRPRVSNANLFDWPLTTMLYGEGQEAAGARVAFANKKGGDMSEWPESLRVREFPKKI